MMKRLALALVLLSGALPSLGQGDFVVNYRGLIAGRPNLTNGFVTLYRSEHGYYIAIESSPSASASWTLRLPVSAGSSGQCLQTNGAGVTSWGTCYTLSGVLLTANNLSELTATASTARTNLGLGTLATQSGTFSGSSSGTNTGDQTITLTGGVTGSGTGAFAATVATNANLTGPITSVGNATTVADGELSALAGLISAADKVPYFTGDGTASVADLTAAARTVLDDTTVGAMVDTLGGTAAQGTGAIVRATSPTLTTPALGTPSSAVLTNATGLPTNGLVDGAVTLAKQANLAQDQFIGRITASTGVPETATITAAARTVLDDMTVGGMVDTLGAAASSGTGGLVRVISPTFTTSARSPLWNVGTASTTLGFVDFYASTHAFFNRFKSSESQTASATYIWPVDDGAASQVMTTDGSGVLSWAAPRLTHGTNATSACTAGGFFTSQSSVIDCGGYATMSSTGAITFGTGIAGASVPLTILRNTSSGNIVNFQTTTGTTVSYVDNAGNIVAPSGMTSGVGFVFAGAPTYGVSQTANRVGFQNAANVFLAASATNGAEVSQDGITFFSTTVNAGTADTFLDAQEAAGTLQMGKDVNGAPVNQIFKAHDGITGSNILGASLTLAPGLGTGNAVSNPLTLNRVNTKATGTTAQTYSPAVITCPTKILSNTSATAQTIATITTTTTTGGSVTMDYTTVANNGTLQDVDGGMVKVSWRNNAGTVAGAMSAVVLQSDSDASGTLATTPTATVATNVVSIKFTPTWTTIVPTTVTGWATFNLFTSGDTLACQ